MLVSEKNLISVFTTIKDHGSLGTISYELLGVVDKSNCTDDLHDQLLEFFKYDHVREYNANFPGAYTRYVTLDKKSKDNKRVPLAMFVPTKDLNPHSDRSFVNRELLKAFRERWTIIEFKESWRCWDDVLSSYPGNNDSEQQESLEKV